MQKLAETLIEKHVYKTIESITNEVWDKYFDMVFKETCERDTGSDTTIGATCRRIEDLARKTVDLRLTAMIGEVSEEMDIVRCSPTQNPFAIVADSLWHEFIYYTDFKGWIESIIEDKWREKQEELEKARILDEDGDYIKR